jgi:hypothetical protein
MDILSLGWAGLMTMFTFSLALTGLETVSNYLNFCKI